MRTMLAVAALALAPPCAGSGAAPVPRWSAEGPASSPATAGPASRDAEARRTAELASLYGSPPELVASLRGIGLGWSDVECAVAISSRAGRPVAEVLDLRKAGMEWGQVAQAYGFMLKDALRAPAAAPPSPAPAPEPPARRPTPVRR